MWVGGQSAQTSAGVADGGWHHVALAWSSPGGRLALYVDGALRAATSLAAGAALPDGGSLLLGQVLRGDCCRGR